MSCNLLAEEEDWETESESGDPADKTAAVKPVAVINPNIENEKHAASVVHKEQETTFSISLPQQQDSGRPPRLYYESQLCCII